MSSLKSSINCPRMLPLPGLSSRRPSIDSDSECLAQRQKAEAKAPDASPTNNSLRRLASTRRPARRAMAAVGSSFTSSMRLHASTSTGNGSGTSSRVLHNILSDDNLDDIDECTRTGHMEDVSTRSYRDSENGMKRATSMDQMPFYPAERGGQEDTKHKKKQPWWKSRKIWIAIIVGMALVATAIVLSLLFVPRKNEVNQSISEPIHSEVEVIEGQFRQVLGIRANFNLTEEEIELYESQMESYTTQYGSPQHGVTTTCTVTEQELHSFGGDFNTTILLVLSFTMAYETDESVINIYAYPSLFKEYIESHSEEVTEDMQSLFLPVLQVGEVLVLHEYNQDDHINRKRTKSPSLQPSHSPKSSPPSLSPTAEPVCLTLQQTNLIDCEEGKHCNLTVGLYHNSAVISKHEQHIKFLSRPDDRAQFQFTAELDPDAFQSLAISDVSISGNVVVIGSAQENNHTGAAYVLEQNSTLGMQASYFVPSDASERAQFGATVDVDRDTMTMAVGAPNDKGGAVYIYHRAETDSRWLQEEKLTKGLIGSTAYGSSISILGHLIAVGDNLHENGVVYVYNRHLVVAGGATAWSKFGEDITNNDCNGRFGSSLALTSDNGIVIGCPENGALYYHEQTETGYVLKQTISATSSDGVLEILGESGQLAVDGRYMIAGTNSRLGMVYVFKYVGGLWIRVATVDAISGSEYFGSQIALSGSNILVSSKTDVYYYTLGDCSTFANSSLAEVSSGPSEYSVRLFSKAGVL